MPGLGERLFDKTVGQLLNRVYSGKRRSEDPLSQFDRQTKRKLRELRARHQHIYDPQDGEGTLHPGND